MVRLPYTQEAVSASVDAGMDMAMVAMNGCVGAWTCTFWWAPS
jgi:hypothetical protein